MKITVLLSENDIEYAIKEYLLKKRSITSIETVQFYYTNGIENTEISASVKCEME
jgi:hypothetical protein